MSLEYPSGPVPLDSLFYTARPPIEELACDEITKLGSLLWIHAPTKMGKTSLLLRILACARALGYQSTILNFQQADEGVFSSVNHFLRWFCSIVSRQLNLPSQLDEYWDEEIGEKMSCTLYFENFLLAQCNTPVVLALNEANRIFEHPLVASEFFPLLRSWSEQAKHSPSFQKLRLAVTYSTDAYLSLALNHSPFSIGLPMELPPFNPQQVQDLAQRHELDLNPSQVEALMLMVGGHPYLVRLALYHLARRDVNFEQLLQTAPTPEGIYRTHLQELLVTLQRMPALASIFKQVISNQGSVSLSPIPSSRLISMGLVKREGERLLPSCELYRCYFQSQNLCEKDVSQQLLQLQILNQELQKLAYLDGLTQVANRRFFDLTLTNEWRRLARQNAPLALVLCDIDDFKLYNDTHGHLAGDWCLQRVAAAIQECTRRAGDLVARYGGEEFAAILPNTDAAGALHVAEAIRKRVKALGIGYTASPVHEAESSLLTVSLGVACAIPKPASDPRALLLAADEALYHSKQQGRDRVTLSQRFETNYQPGLEDSNR